MDDLCDLCHLCDLCDDVLTHMTSFLHPIYCLILSSSCHKLVKLRPDNKIYHMYEPVAMNLIKLTAKMKRIVTQNYWISGAIRKGCVNVEYCDIDYVHITEAISSSKIHPYLSSIIDITNLTFNKEMPLRVHTISGKITNCKSNKMPYIYTFPKDKTTFWVTNAIEETIDMTLKDTENIICYNKWVIKGHVIDNDVKIPIMVISEIDTITW